MILFHPNGIRPVLACSRLFGIAMILVAWTVATSARASSDEELWIALRDAKAFAMIRHAVAPGYGDPTDFKLGECSTQRNLSAEGRSQARGIGELFRRNGIVGADVYTSQWCRCRETARLLSLGDVADMPELNSFFGDAKRREPQTTALSRWLDFHSPRRPLVLVTHQVNISALTGHFATSGEIVVVSLEPGSGRKVLGAIKTQRR